MLEEKDACAAIMALLSLRPPGATICPSEVAKALVVGAGEEPVAKNWRGAMRLVHAAVDGLVLDGSIRLSWKGKLLAMRAGPYRIARGEGE